MEDDRSYQASYRGRTIMVKAPSSYQAQLRDAQIFGVRKAYQVTVVLADQRIGAAGLG